VPPLPTGCYTKDDKFSADIATAIAALEEAISRQSKINSDIEEQFNQMDGATRSSRWMAYLQKNPAAAMKQIEEAQTLAPKHREAAAANDAKRAALDERYKTLEAQYRADFHKTLGPLVAVFSPQTVSPASEAERRAALARFNTEYPKLCAKWTTAGAFPEYLKDYKRFLVEDVIPLDESSHAMKKAQYEQFGIATTSMLSTATMEAVVKYMRIAELGYQNLREVAPRTLGG